MITTLNGLDVDKIAARFWSKVDTSGAECWTWKGAINQNGYGNFYINAHTVQAHRIAWLLAHEGEDIPAGLLVLHTCDNKSCAKPQHLEIGTQSKNQKDAYARGLRVGNFGPHYYVRGERSGTAKLTWADVDKIRALYGKGFLYRELAERFNVSVGTIQRIIENKGWYVENPTVTPRARGGYHGRTAKHLTAT